MELYTAGLLGTIGYMLSKNEKPKTISKFKNKENHISRNEKPSVDSVYSGKHFNKTIEDTIRKASKMHDKGVNSDNVIPINTKHISTDKNVYSRLSNVEMNENEFKHNNMVPFFGGKMTQNVNLEKSHSKNILDKFTGNNQFYKKKSEVENFAADIKNNSQNVFGQENTLEFQKKRFVNSAHVTNYLPFEQELVGPGLNQGYESKPSGGFQQINKREFELPKGVDDLRVKTNPKNTYDGRIVNGQKELLPGDIGDVCKNTVDIVYEQTEDMYLKSGNSQNQKDTQRPCVNLKQTNRSDTMLKTHNSNVTYLVKSLTAPLLDIMKVNKKEFTIMNGRPMGNLQNTNPSKLTIYDPNDIARTTIKETLIHDTRQGNIKGNFGVEKTIAYDPDDVTRTTMRETTENSKRDGNIGNLQSSDAYKSINVNAKDTGRQLTSNNQYYGVGDSANDKPMLYTDKYNATINEVKEMLLKERRPTKTSVKVFNQVDNMNLNHKKIECDQANMRTTQNYGRIINQIPSTNNITNTKDRFIYNNDNRINPDILSPLKNNPYSKPLNVF
jgi:hypothetical protein